ncbi:MAG: peptidase U32 family protein [Deltaproteobacteria bacterium]
MGFPELVMPAGSLEKMKTALVFGADAVYLGGKEFSLRAYAGNLTLQEIAEGLKFARERGSRVYITVNALARNRDIDRLPAYLEELARLGVDGLIISDPGVLRLARKYAPELPLTVSTQASVCNYETAAFYRELGARRVVLARELSMEEIALIKQRADIEIEVFIHGAMCVSYSGRCLLSHYMTGRGANQGECAHPCRYRYALVEEKRPGQYYPIEEDEKGSYILNSRDLCLLEYLPRLAEIGIDAFKVEGRMKSPLYVASVASVYRRAMDALEGGRGFEREQLEEWRRELVKTATRPFTNGFVEGESPWLQDISKEAAQNRSEFCGVVRGWQAAREIVEVEQRGNFGPGDPLELLIPGGEVLPITIDALFDEEGNSLDRARHPRQRVFFPVKKAVPEHTILRKVN